MRSEIKKGLVQKIMDKLVDEEHLIAKQYNSMIYLVNQKIFKEISEDEIRGVDEELDKIKNDLDVVKLENTKLQNDFKNLNTTITNEELDKKLLDLRKETNEMEKLFKKIESGNIIKIPEEKVKEAENTYNKELNNYKKIKRVCNNILESLADGFEMKKKEFNVRIY
jgi:hypothetical protein